MKVYVKSALDNSNIPDENKNGDCFKVAFEALTRNHNTGYLVHGVVTGRGAIEGLQYAHAWVEDAGEVFDNTLPDGLKQLPKEVYYGLANVVLTRKYNFKQALENAVSTETYGPWDNVFDNYY